MYEFIAHYIDMENKNHTKLIQVDLTGIDSECMNFDSELLFAWKQACNKAIGLIDNPSVLLDSIEFLSC